MFYTKRLAEIVGKFLLWGALFYQSRNIGFGEVFLICSCFYLIYSNLGKREEGQLSAYSVFNENFQELPGTLNAARIDSELRSIATPSNNVQAAAQTINTDFGQVEEDFDEDLQRAIRASLEDFKSNSQEKKRGKKKGFRQRRAPN